MTALKGRDIAKFVDAGLNDPRCVLIYGANQGRVEHFSQKLITSFYGGPAPSDSVVTLDADAINSDPALLYDQANASSLFGDKVLVRVRGTIKNPQKSVKALLEETPANPVIILAENLNTSSPLRKLFEKSKSAYALPCYDPDMGELRAFIQERLQRESKSINTDALGLLLNDIHFDLGYVAQETDKLILYVGDKQAIDINDVLAVSANMKDTDISVLADAIGNGELAKFENEFDKCLESSSSTSGVHIMVQNHFHMLLGLRLVMEEQRQAASQAVKSHRPPIFFKRQDIIARQLSRWTLNDLQKALEKIQHSILFTRQHPQLEVSHMGMTYLSLCAQAARH